MQQNIGEAIAEVFLQALGYILSLPSESNGTHVVLEPKL
jgi:hypothetical protein